MSDVVSFRSTLKRHPPLPSIRHINLVELKGGRLVNVDGLNPMQKFLYRNARVTTVITERQHLIFKLSLYTQGFRVNAKLTMLIAPDYTSPEIFMNSFYKGNRTNQITTGLIVAALRPHIKDEVIHNLSFVNLGRVPIGASIKNATRHNHLVAICKNKGLHLLTDDLVLDAVY